MSDDMKVVSIGTVREIVTFYEPSLHREQPVKMSEKKVLKQPKKPSEQTKWRLVFFFFSLKNRV